MSKTVRSFQNLPASTRRSGTALAAMMRKAGKMKHRNDQRGGQTNSQADLMEDLEDEYGDWE